MENTDFIIKKLQHYLENFESLTDEELKQATWFVLYKANEQINRSIETNKDVLNQNEIILEQNNDLADKIVHYRKFIDDSRLTKRYELYSKGREAI